MPAADRLVHRVGLALPDLPNRLEGLRIAQISDLHISRPRRRYEQVAAALDGREVDLIFLTGDYMSDIGGEPAAMEVLRRMVTRLRARLGVFGVFGNHDSPQLRELCRELPVRWLHNEAARPDPLIEVLGLDMDMASMPDAVELVTKWAAAPEPSPFLAGGQGEGWGPSSDKEKKIPSLPPSPSEGRGGGRPLRLMLAHLPTVLPVAADLGVDVLFCGHTHGGQCRLPGGYALRNSTDMPLSLTSGVLRHQRTLCVISRGLGEILLPFRTWCPPHLPIVTLRRGPMAGAPTFEIRNLQPW